MAFAVNNAGATPSEFRLREWDVFSQGCQSATLGWNWPTLSALFISAVLQSRPAWELCLFCFPFSDEFFHVGDLCWIGFGVLANLDRLFAGGDGLGRLALFGEYARPKA